MNHPLPLEGPLVNYFQILRCPPENTEIHLYCSAGRGSGVPRAGEAGVTGWAGWTPKAKVVWALELRKRNMLGTSPAKARDTPHPLPFP